MKNSIFLLLLFNLSCRNSNESIVKYIHATDNKSNPVLSIDFDFPENKEHIYKTFKTAFYNDSVYIADFSIYLWNNLFIARLNNPISKDFILFDLNYKINYKKSLDIFEYKRKIKSFDIILEQIIKTKDNLQVFVFQIKNWGKLSPEFGNKEINLIVFVTKKMVLSVHIILI